MPKGPGTYGSKKGRPPETGIPTYDAGGRTQSGDVSAYNEIGTKIYKEGGDTEGRGPIMDAIDWVTEGQRRKWKETISDYVDVGQDESPDKKVDEPVKTETEVKTEPKTEPEVKEPKAEPEVKVEPKAEPKAEPKKETKKKSSITETGFKIGSDSYQPPKKKEPSMYEMRDKAKKGSKEWAKWQNKINEAEGSDVRHEGKTSRELKKEAGEHYVGEQFSEEGRAAAKKRKHKKQTEKKGFSDKDYQRVKSYMEKNWAMDDTINPAALAQYKKMNK